MIWFSNSTFLAKVVCGGCIGMLGAIKEHSHVTHACMIIVCTDIIVLLTTEGLKREGEV